jgi:hypothetical protein
MRVFLWIGLAAAPLAWATQLVAGTALEEAACTPGGIGDGGVEPATVAIGAAAAVVAVAGAAVSYLAYREAPAEPAESARTAAFLAAAGLVASLVLLGAIVASALVIVSLDACHPA